MTLEIETDAPWHVVQVHTHAEAKAQMHLNRQGFGTYLPRYLKRRRHARRTEIVAAPLYPSYLFVTFNPLIHRWRSIQSTVGVARLVCNGEVSGRHRRRHHSRPEKPRERAGLYPARTPAAICCRRQSARARRRVHRLSRPVRVRRRSRPRCHSPRTARPQGACRSGRGVRRRGVKPRPEHVRMADTRMPQRSCAIG